jgi:rfaE bifunctional protein nucleotidyltransferase chain/domain
MKSKSKSISFDSLGEWRKTQREAGLKVVVTNGCFDILHAGHVAYLEAARDLGDALLVGLNSDASVRALKGPQRPVNSEADRAFVLGGLESVSAVCVFMDASANKFLEAAQPDIYVKGGDYTLETINQEERRTVESCGGKIVFIPMVPDKSTTALIKKIGAPV